MFKFLITLVFLVIINPVHAYVSVGPSGVGSCTYETIGEALESGDPEIRLSGGHFLENIEIDSSVVIRGGFFNCLSASLNTQSDANTVIDGGFLVGAPTVNIDSSDFLIVNFENVTIRNARDTQFVNGGHGVDLNNTSGIIKFENSLIADNTAENGGGIYSNNPSGNLDIVIDSSSVFGNSASEFGGGIYCTNSNTSVIIRNGSYVGENTAEHGGGIAAINGCSVFVDSGVDVNNSFDLRGVMNNTVTGNGGGIYLDGSGLILQGNTYSILNLGNNTDPVTVANNTSGSNGGGIYATNDSMIEVIDGLIFNNTSQLDGAGIYLSAGSELTMSPASKACWNKGQCSVLANNTTSTQNFGGAVFALNNSKVNINNTHLFGNRAQFGSVIYARDLDSAQRVEVNLDGNYIYLNANNGSGGYLDELILRGFGFVDISILHNTIAGNDIADSSTIIGIRDGVNLSISNSIIYNINENILSESGNNNTVTTNCAMVNENVTIAATPLNGFTPGFVDENNHDYHLTATSLMRDACANEGGIGVDTDNENRGFDDTISNLLGPYDAGADETYLNDVIFKSDFD